MAFLQNIKKCLNTCQEYYQKSSIQNHLAGKVTHMQNELV